MKAYTPTEASSNTSSPVKNNFSELEGSAPLTKFKSSPQPAANPHARIGVPGFNTPSHGNLTSGGMGHTQNPEMRNPVNGVPHISMKPGK